MKDPIRITAASAELDALDAALDLILDAVELCLEDADGGFIVAIPADEADTIVIGGAQ